MIRLLISLLLIVGATCAEAATPQLILGRTDSLTSATVTQYQRFGFTTRAGWDDLSTELRNVIIVSTAGTISDFRMNVGTVPGSGTSYKFTARKGQVSQPITCTISNTNDECEDLNNTFTVVAGDVLTLESDPTNTPATTTTSWSYIFTPDVDDNYLYSGSNSGGGLTVSTKNYIAFHGDISSAGGNADSVVGVIPFAGTIKNLRVDAQIGPGVGKTRTITLELNGSATSLTCDTTGNGADSCNDLVSTVSVVKGDEVQITAEGSPVGAGFNGDPMSISMTFVSDSPGFYPILTDLLGALGTSATQYFSVGVTLALTETTESLTQSRIEQDRVTGIFIHHQTGTHGDLTFTLRNNSADTNMSCTILSSETSCEATGEESYADDDLINFKVTDPAPSGARTGQFGASLIAGSGSARRFYRTY